MKKISLIVTDSGPLITLAIADALDTLLLPKQRVIIPDMVKFELTRHIDKPGALAIARWIRKNEPGRVYVASTEAYEEFNIVLAAKPDALTKGRGEASAAEILARELEQGIDVGILLFEDSDVRKDNFLVRVPDNVLIMSTSEYLFGMEAGGLINSAMAIIEKSKPVRGDRVAHRHLQPTSGAEDAAVDFHKKFKP